MIPAYLSPLVTHLWQSTLFAAVAALLAVGLRRNRAAVRYRLWLAASVKFLIPFSWLVALGSRFEWRAAPALVAPSVSAAIGQFFVPQALAVGATSVAATPLSAGISVPALLLAIWALGVAAVLFSWWRQWRPVRKALSRATPLALDTPILNPKIAVMSSPHLLEPGVVGIRRPVLLLPEGIADRLQPSQLNAILVHELCHVRRRDNLAAVMHMVVEALYWFHPLVWWIERRLVDEREWACDEEVLRMGSEPDVYATGILNVCKFYAESPVICASGVTGSNLKKRIEIIMTNRIADKLNVTKKLLLAAAGVAAVVGPVVVGVMDAPGLRAQSSADNSRPLAFDAASVTPNRSSSGPANADLLPGPSQSPSLTAPSFAAASVKPNKSGSPAIGITPQTGGRYTATNMSVGQLLRSAYGIPMFRLVGGPDWIESERFDVVATAGHNATFNEMRLMMQTLLAERFKLKVHAENQEQPVFELVMARRDGRLGPSLRRSEVDCTGKDWPNDLPGGAPPQCGFIGPDPEIPIVSGRSRFALRGTSMEAFSRFLQGAGRRYVFNRTGLSGYFDGEFDFTAEMGPPAPPDRPDLDRANLPSIFTVVQEQLGLKLEGTRGPVEVLVIDSVDRPTPD